MTADFDEVMNEFAAEMEAFEETMREVDELLSEYETKMGRDTTPGGSPATGD